MEGSKTLRHYVVHISILLWSTPGVVAVSRTNTAVFRGIKITVVVSRQVFLGGDRTQYKTKLFIIPTNQAIDHGIGFFTDGTLINLCTSRKRPTCLQIKRPTSFQI